MATDTVDDDELDLDEEDRKRALLKNAGATPPTASPQPEPPPKSMSIGTPIRPTADATPAPVPAPEEANPPINATPPAGAVGMSIRTPPKAPTELPQYHGLNRVLDTIAGATNIGTAIERAGGFGTQGHLARIENEQQLEANQAAEAAKQAEASRANAEAAEAATRGQTEAETAKVGNELVDVTLPDGTKTQVMRKNIASPTAAIINSASRENVANTNAGARTDVADTNARAREETARIMVGGKPMATKNIMGNDNKPHVMMWNPNTHTYDRDLGVAPTASATSAYANTRTTTLIDPETGLPTVYQFDPNTQTYSKQVGVSATGPYGHEMAQAGAVERSGNELIKEIDANRDRIGDVGAVWNAAFTGSPLSDPYQSGLAAQIASFAALNPALHGARGVTAMKEFEKIYGSPINNPDSLIAAIQAGMKTAGNIAPQTKTPTNKNANKGNRPPLESFDRK